MKLKGLLALILCLSLVIPISLSRISAPTFFVYVDNGGSIGFQSMYLTELNLTVTSGALNCSNATLRAYTDRGRFIFMNNESCTFTLRFDVSRVQVNSVLQPTSGPSFSYAQNQTTTIEWWITHEPFLPYMFILGMIGLGSMFAGPIVAIKGIKENPKGALTIGITLTALGIGLFMAWLSAG